MRILQIIHGYPPYYMAGSEVYTYNLSRALADLGHEIYVFTRIEDPFSPPYSIINESYNNIHVTRINKPFGEYNLIDKYIDKKLDAIFEKYIETVEPDIVHIQHLSHLSTNIVKIIKSKKKRIVFTLHDYWLICIRGQLISREFRLCEGPSTIKCLRCLSYLNPSYRDVVDYIEHMKTIINYIDIFLAPSETLMNIMIRNGIPKDKIIYSPYGFNKNLIKYDMKTWKKGDKIKFGFVGRIIPTKGVHILIDAFNKIKDKYNTELYIYGSLNKYGIYLEKRAGDKVYFMGGFNHKTINKVLENIDVLIVPSIWYENSPLVIHEAFLKGRPVITSNLGGMKELIEKYGGGLLFRVGDSTDLANKMSYILEDPSILNKLKPNPNNIKDIHDDASEIEKIYWRLLT